MTRWVSAQLSMTLVWTTWFSPCWDPSEGWNQRAESILCIANCSLSVYIIYNWIQLSSRVGGLPVQNLALLIKSYFHEDRSVPSMRVGQGRSTQAFYSHVFAYTYMLLHHICMGTQGLVRTIFNIIHPCQGSFCRTSLVSFLAKSWILSVSKLWHLFQGRRPQSWSFPTRDRSPDYYKSLQSLGLEVMRDL